jgi:hypothetical protein
MSQTNATTGVASSGNTVGLSRARKTTGEQVLGKEEKLGELVYKFNTKDQADMYLRTTEVIADFVGVEYGRDMRMLVSTAQRRPSPNQVCQGAKTLLQDGWRSTRQNSGFSTERRKNFKTAKQR